jgi:hypothetical protein
MVSWKKYLIQHASFFFMITFPRSFARIINRPLTICIDNHLLTLTRPSDRLEPSNGAMTRLVGDMVERYGAHPGSPQAGHAAAIKALWQLAYREASTLAYADAFRLMMIVLVIATCWYRSCARSCRPGLPRRRHIRTPFLVAFDDRNVWSHGNASSRGSGRAALCVAAEMGNSDHSGGASIALMSLL